MVTEEGPACARQSRAREGLADSLFKTELAACGGDGPARRGTGCGEMRGFCWTLRGGTAGLETEQLDDKDAYREAWGYGDVWGSAKAQTCMGEGGRGLGLCCSPLYPSAWSSHSV